MKRGETPADLVTERNIVEFASDAMREMVDAKGFLPPFERELLQEWQGQSYALVKSMRNPYRKREFSVGRFHTLDAGKMLVAGMRLAAPGGVLNSRAERTPVLDVFMGASSAPADRRPITLAGRCPLRSATTTVEASAAGELLVSLSRRS
jgi:hypothetical protein